LVDDEWHGGDELTGDGGWCPHDPTWTPEETVDDRDSWGKTTAHPWGLATREESPNGEAEQRLVGSEGAAAAYLDVGEKAAESGKLQPSNAFIAWRRETTDDYGPARQ
jgi:hypothetical protein